jgi:hypothetical protein
MVRRIRLRMRCPRRGIGLVGPHIWMLLWWQWRTDERAGEENPEWTANRVLKFFVESNGFPSVDLAFLKDRRSSLGVLGGVLEMVDWSATRAIISKCFNQQLIQRKDQDASKTQNLQVYYVVLCVRAPEDRFSFCRYA